jgi:hypothetical protein
MKVAIHANPGVQWQRRFAEFFKTGFAKHGIAASVTQSAGRERGTDVAVLFGPNYWKQVERSGEPYLIVNRVLVSRNPRHVHDVVAISWDGLNGRGTFCVDDIDETRLEQFISPSKDVAGWRKQGDYLLLCGQADIGRCGRYGSVAEWYRLVENTANEPVVFRAHPNNGPRVPLRTHLRGARSAAVRAVDRRNSVSRKAAVPFIFGQLSVFLLGNSKWQVLGTAEPEAWAAAVRLRAPDMNQSRISSAIEAAVNIVIGYATGVIGNLIILPLFGFDVQVSDAFYMAMIFTTIGLVRSYVIRRWFNARLHAAAVRAAEGQRLAGKLMAFAVGRGW